MHKQNQNASPTSSATTEPRASKTDTFTSRTYLSMEHQIGATTEPFVRLDLIVQQPTVVGFESIPAPCFAAMRPAEGEIYLPGPGRYNISMRPYQPPGRPSSNKDDSITFESHMRTMCTTPTASQTRPPSSVTTPSGDRSQPSITEVVSGAASPGSTIAGSLDGRPPPKLKRLHTRMESEADVESDERKKKTKRAGSSRSGSSPQAAL